jgi:hypothetical protein
MTFTIFRFQKCIFRVAILDNARRKLPRIVTLCLSERRERERRGREREAVDAETK